MLQEARVELIDLDLCNSTQWYGGRIRSTNVCAGYPEGKVDTCQVTNCPGPALRTSSHVPLPHTPGACPFPGPISAVLMRREGTPTSYPDQNRHHV